MGFRRGRVFGVSLLAGGLLAFSPGSASATVFTFDGLNITGHEQTYSVPAGVHFLDATAIGAQGGSIQMDQPYGDGQAAQVSGRLPVSPGQTLYVEVGGRSYMGLGGWNGGGNSRSGGGGGGASDVRTIPRASANSLGSRILVAAGSGGEGGNPAPAGDAGADAPDEELVYPAGSGGGAGTQTAGGAGGTGADPGVAGTLGQGGDGGDCCPDSFSSPGGGGGGGLYGGGGGGSQTGGFGLGGGGGSSLVPAGGTFDLAPAGTPALVVLNVAARPDALIARDKRSDPDLGDGAYNSDGSAQTREWTAKPKKKRSFRITLQNDAEAQDSFAVNGCAKSKGFKVKYFAGGQSVTDEVTAGKYSTAPADPGASTTLQLQIKVSKKAKKGKKKCLVTAASKDEPTELDAVKAVLKVKGK